MGNWADVRHVAEDRLIDLLRQRRDQQRTAAQVIARLYWTDVED